jgi:hypothetical protein
VDVVYLDDFLFGSAQFAVLLARGVRGGRP